MKGLLRATSRSEMVGVVHLRIKEGVDLLGAIKEGALREGVRAAVFLSGIGALRKAVFRNLKEFPQSFPVNPSNRLYYEMACPMELVSLTGWIGTMGDEIEVHAHFSASTVMGDKVVTLGGHLTEGTITSVKVVVSLGVLPSGSMLRCAARGRWWKRDVARPNQGNSGTGIGPGAVLLPNGRNPGMVDMKRGPR